MATSAAEGGLSHASQPPSSSLQLSRDEVDLYARIFKVALGGGREQDGPAASSSSAAGLSEAEILLPSRGGELLATTRLAPEALHRIWVLAAERTASDRGLDFEGFAVACRLCAHAQQGNLAAEQLEERLVLTVPPAPPWFEGLSDSSLLLDDLAPQSSPRSISQQSVQSVQSVQSQSFAPQSSPRGGAPDDGFDFDAAAFGGAQPSSFSNFSPRGGGESRSSGGGIAAAPPAAPRRDGDGSGALGGPSGLCGSPAASQLVGLGVGGKGSRPPDHGEGSFEGINLETEGFGSSAALAAAMQDSGGSSSASSRHRSPPGGPSAVENRLLAELLETREELERRHAQKRFLERRAAQARAQLHDCREKRRRADADRAREHAAVTRLVKELDFTTQQTQLMTQLVVDLRESAREEKLSSSGDMQSSSNVSGREENVCLEDSEKAQDYRAALLLLQRNREAVASQRQRAERQSRAVQDLQGRQQLLGEANREALQDRQRLLQTLERDRVQLHDLRSGRMALGKVHSEALDEAHRLARDAGLPLSHLSASLSLGGAAPSGDFAPLPQHLAAPLSRRKQSGGGSVAAREEPQGSSGIARVAAYDEGAGGGSWSRELLGGASSAARVGTLGGTAERPHSRWAQFGGESTSQEHPREHERASNWSEMSGSGRGRQGVGSRGPLAAH